MNVVLTFKRMNLARAWARVAFGLRFLIGVDRAQRFAIWGGTKIARYRVGNGPWLRLNQPARRSR